MGHAEGTLSGTIEKYQWTQPHTFIWIVVPDKSRQDAGVGFGGHEPEAGSDRGWGLHSLNAGDKK